MDCDVSPFWSDTNWNEPLTKENVLTYFQRSPFYDKASNNSKPFYKSVVGFYYDLLLVSEDSRLFIIKRVEQKLADTSLVTDYYYILDTLVYKSPNVGNLLRTKLLNVSASMNKVLNSYMKIQDKEEDTIDYTQLM